MNICKAIWFYGFSGCGKTHASKVISEFIENPFVIDGDDVRKYVSVDLGYELSDRYVQINRIFGIAKISLNNGYFPIISSVVMNDEVLEKCQINGIKVINYQALRSES